MTDRRIKVHLFGWGPVKHHAGDFDVTPEFYKNLKESFDFMTSGSDGRPPRFPPILRQHTEDGFVYGRVVGLTDQGDEPGITAEVELCEDAYEWWRDGKIGDWSPSFVDEFEDRHSDTILKNFLRELSFVSVGHLMNTRIKSPAYSLQDEDGLITTNPSGGKPMENKENKPVENEGSSGATLDSIAAQLATLVELLTRNVDLEDDEEKNLEDQEEDKAKENESKEDEEKKELAARLAGIEKQLAAERKERARLHLESIGLDSKSPAAKPLIELAASDRAAFDGAVKLMSDSLGKKAPKAFQDTEAGGAGFAEIGSDGFRKLAAQAKADGAKNLLEGAKMLEARGYIKASDASSLTPERVQILRSVFQ